MVSAAIVLSVIIGSLFIAFGLLYYFKVITFGKGDDSKPDTDQDTTKSDCPNPDPDWPTKCPGDWGCCRTLKRLANQ